MPPAWGSSPPRAAVSCARCPSRVSRAPATTARLLVRQHDEPRPVEYAMQLPARVVDRFGLRAGARDQIDPAAGEQPRQILLSDDPAALGLELPAEGQLPRPADDRRPAIGIVGEPLQDRTVRSNHVLRPGASGDEPRRLPD